MTAAPVEVVRSGTALSIGGRLVRRIDLAPILGVPTPETPRFVSARSIPAPAGRAAVDIKMTDGTVERVPASALPWRAATGAGTDTRTADLIVEGASTVITADGTHDAPLGPIPDGAVVASAGRVLWVGPRSELTSCGFELSGAMRVDAGGRLVSPGLVNCHAHPMFAGNRADEFARRAAGHSYREIAEAGGGIAATIGPTRAASFDELVALTWHRVGRALAAGTTTCEAKTGYDLTVEGELRLLQVAAAVDALHAVDLVPTVLGAHIVPPERTRDRAGFVADVAERLIPAAARGLAHAVDVYCDDGAFDLAETRVILTAGRDHGLVVRAHAGQFADLGCPELVADLGGTSADHLECISDRGIRAMAVHDVVAVMLPGACVQLRQTPPPVQRLRDGGVALAIGTDMNPGTTMGETLPVQMWLATTHYGMTVEEAWLGVTHHAARALGRHDIGVLAAGALADLVIWDAKSPAEIPYRYDARLAHQVIKAGRIAG